jgi:hypothetical protein
MLTGWIFWNNSFAIQNSLTNQNMALLSLRKLVAQDAKKGELVVSADWVDHTGKVLLTEETTYKFSGKDNMRIIERVTKLKQCNKLRLTKIKKD